MTFWKLCLIFCLLPLLAWAEKYDGPGPDPACGGTSLTIEKKDGAVVFIEYAIFGSEQVRVEKYRPLKNGEWNVTVEQYSATPTANGDTKQKLLSAYQFKSDDEKRATKVSAKLGVPEMNWGKEPARLIKFFEKNRKEFQPY